MSLQESLLKQSGIGGLEALGNSGSHKHLSQRREAVPSLVFPSGYLRESELYKKKSLKRDEEFEPVRPANQCQSLSQVAEIISKFNFGIS